MIDYKNKLSPVLIFLNKHSKILWKYLSFSLTDNFFSIAGIVSISVEADGIYIVFGKKIFWKTLVKYFKKFPLEEDKALSPEYLAAVVSKALAEMDVTRASFVLSIPRSWTIVQVAEFPSTVKENLANVISYELDRLTPLTPENACYDFKTIAEDQEKIKILLTVAKADRVKPFLEALQNKNIKIEKLSISSYVIRILLKETYKSKNFILISINNKAYECAAIVNDFTVRSLSGAIQEMDDIQLDRVVKEASSLIELLPKSGSPGKIIINADENNYRILSKKLSTLPVFSLRKNIIKGNGNVSPFALGHFLEKAADDQNGFNLLAAPNGKQKRNPFLVSVILLAAIMLFAVLHIMSPIFIEQNNIDQIDKRITSLKPAMKKINALRQEMDAVSSEIKSINDFKKNNISTMDIIREITRILPAKAWLTRIRITENSVEIEGYATSATEIIPKLENSSYFQKAEFASPTLRDQRQNNERFVIKMELKKNNNSPKKEEKTGEKNERKK